MFITHARTPEALRAEVVSDIERRIRALDSYTRVMKPSAQDKAKIAHTAGEFESMLEFWKTLTIMPAPKRKVSFTANDLKTVNERRVEKGLKPIGEEQEKGDREYPDNDTGGL